MAENPKYIIFEGPLCQEVVIFSSVMTHSNVAICIGHEVVSAGFVEFSEHPQAYGESVSLGIKSRPEDTARILRHLNIE